MRTNPILNTDSYKASHYLQYPAGTTTISSYIESRGGQYEKSVSFGLQAFLKEYLTQPITRADIDEARDMLAAHGVPFHEKGFEHILARHEGLLPVEIEAVEEGTVLPVKNVMLQIRNTDPECFWLTSYLETALLRAIWYPTTVATLSWHCKQTIVEFLKRTSDTPESVAFKLHDFGARGASSLETAALGGMAHLVNFSGSDTIAGVMAARKYYHELMAGFSIPAAEHSTITSWGKEQECDAYRNMLTQFAGPGKFVAVVSDSYDLWHAIDTHWGKTLKQAIIDNGGTLVIRPDSGHPVEIVCQALEKLLEHFGGTTNSKGYRLLPSYIRVIQGDGVSPEMIRSILFALELKGISAENIAFGMGGELLQKVNRDTLKFAMKASAAEVNGVWRDVYKDPVTDAGKKSKRGRLALIRENEEYHTIRQDELGNRQNLLSPVFRNGKILRDVDFKTVRANANQ